MRAAEGKGLKARIAHNTLRLRQLERAMSPLIVEPKRTTACTKCGFVILGPHYLKKRAPYHGHCFMEVYHPTVRMMNGG